MNITTNRNILIAAAVIAMLALVALYPIFAKANVITQGIVPHVASDASVAVGPDQALTVSAGSSNCAARVISTASTSIMLSFASTFTPTATVGHYQPASTTVSYDNGQYGCGPIKAWGSASGTVAVASLTQ